MKKTRLIALSMAILMLSASVLGCSNQQQTTSGTAELVELQEKLDVLSKKNEELEDTNAELAAQLVASMGFSADDFIEWMKNENATAAIRTNFLAGAENRPSDDELVTMLELANTYLECHGLGAAHFVVVKGEEKQQEILKFMPQETSGTVLVLVFADGVKDQEYHKAQYYPGTSAQNGGNPEYWQMHLGIYETGWASGYLNLLAASMGYRVRAYAALNFMTEGFDEVQPYATGGNWNLIRGGYWDASEYLKSASGKEFDHYVPILKDYIPADGNLQLLCVISIGKVDENNLETATSSFNEKQTNYDFWD